MLASELPAPDTMIECENGTFNMLMFHYAAAEQSLADIAIEHGFDVTALTVDEDDPLWAAYDEDADAFFRTWRPEKDGWSLGITFDNDDGPVALFIRKARGEPRPTKTEGEG